VGVIAFDDASNNSSLH